MMQVIYFVSDIPVYQWTLTILSKTEQQLLNMVKTGKNALKSFSERIDTDNFYIPLKKRLKHHEQTETAKTNM